MWSDNETTQDFLNFTSLAATVAKIVEGANGQPISIGVSGSWGVGKSSLIKLIRRELDNNEHNQTQADEKKGGYLFVAFDHWVRAKAFSFSTSSLVSLKRSYDACAKRL